MNMKVKVAIAAIILIALVALIVIDQTSTPIPQDGKTKTTRKKPDSIFSRTRNTNRSTPPSNRTTELIFKNPVKETTVLPKPDQKNEPTSTTQKPEVTIKGSSETETTEGIKAVDIVGLEFEEYQIKPGDTLSSIAARKYGDQNLWNVISNANPGIRANALRVGKKIKIPARPTVASTSNEIETIAGRRTYTVQPGDTLGGISKKVYNTTKHADRIFEENRSLLESPDELHVGTKLQLPNIPTTTTTTPPPPTGIDPLPGEELLGDLIHKVKSNDSLWKIAEKYREGRNILRVIEEIISANPRKLFNDSTPLKVGWDLVIPN